MNCIKCGIESKTRFCSDKCRKADYRDRKNASGLNMGQCGTNVSPEMGQNVPKVGQIADGTNGVGQMDLITVRPKSDHETLEDWANGNGTAFQQGLGQLNRFYSYPNGAFHKKLVGHKWVSPIPDVSGVCHICGKDLSDQPRPDLLTTCYNCATSKQSTQEVLINV
jgi:hypothetical protein